MAAIPVDQQQSAVERLTSACGGSYTPEQRRKYFITGPQWAAAYEGNSLFQDRTRETITFERVIEEYAKIGIGYWCTHDTDVIPTDKLGKSGQDEIVGRIAESLNKNGLKCSMVTTETFHNPVWAASPAAHADQVREYANWRVENTVSIIDTQEMKVAGTIKVNGGPDDMDITADGKELWVTQRFLRRVAVVDLAQMKVVAPLSKTIEFVSSAARSTISLGLSTTSDVGTPSNLDSSPG